MVQDEEAHRQNYQQQIQDLTAKIKRTEEVLRSTTTDFILCRRDKQEAQTQAAAAEQMLRDSQQAAAAKVRLSLLYLSLYILQSIRTMWHAGLYLH